MTEASFFAATLSTEEYVLKLLVGAFLDEGGYSFSGEASSLAFTSFSSASSFACPTHKLSEESSYLACWLSLVLSVSPFGVGIQPQEVFAAF